MVLSDSEYALQKFLKGARDQKVHFVLAGAVVYGKLSTSPDRNVAKLTNATIVTGSTTTSSTALDIPYDHILAWGMGDHKSE